MHLLIDVGNSRVKWLYGQSVPGIVEALSYKNNWQEKLYRAWHLLPQPRMILLSSVNHPEISAYIEALAYRLWRKKIHVVQSQKESASLLSLAYEEAHRLGTDRYLAMLGARHLRKEALCVVGCGTAITLDAIDETGKHLGGFILPGMRLAENALLNHTQKLVPMRWTPHLLGKDTASCIGAGIHHVLPAGVDAVADELENQYGFYFHRIAFGGDAAILFGNRPHYQIEPDLIFRGMLFYAQVSRMIED